VRILIYSISFKPDLVGVAKYSGEMAAWLTEQGHEVRVIAAPPYYPDWKIPDGYSGWRYSRETVDGMELYRCPTWVPAEPSGLKRLLHLLSFALSSFPTVMLQALWRPDVVWVVEPTFFVFPIAILLARLTGAKSWAHVQDLEIDAAFDLGILPSAFRRFALSLERFLLKPFDQISSISENMLTRIAEKGVPPSKLKLFPNWIDTESFHPLPYPSSFRKELGIPNDKVVALYSGNMGGKQGFENLVSAMQELEHRTDLHFVLCGQGPSRAMLMDKFGSSPNVHFLPLQPLERFNELLNLADIHLLPQRADAADLVMPAKLLGMFASGRPVVAAAQPETQLAKAVTGCGLVVPPDDSSSFASAINQLADNSALRQGLGVSARNFAVTRMNAAAILPQFSRDLFALQQPTGAAMKSSPQLGD
jgi:colanic acid biosynthesis glycosyl transferase WcaI